MTNPPYEIAITGGIGSGKTFICKVFEKLGTPVYYADSKAKELVNSNQNLAHKIQSLLGKESYMDGIYNTKYVANKVFNDAELLSKLNSIIHPAVAEDYRLWVIENNSSSYVLKESALIFELNLQKLFHKTIVVTAPNDLRTERIIKRDPWRNKTEIESIFEKQLNSEEAASQADFILATDESELLLPQIVKIHDSLIKS